MRHSQYVQHHVLRVRAVLRDPRVRPARVRAVVYERGDRPPDPEPEAHCREREWPQRHRELPPDAHARPARHRQPEQREHDPCPRIQSARLTTHNSRRTRMRGGQATSGDALYVTPAKRVPRRLIVSIFFSEIRDNRDRNIEPLATKALILIQFASKYKLCYRVSDGIRIANFVSQTFRT